MGPIQMIENFRIFTALQRQLLRVCAYSDKGTVFQRQAWPNTPLVYLTGDWQREKS